MHEPRRSLRVGAVQLSSNGSVAENLAAVRDLCAAAARAGAELVVLPENFAFFGPEQEKRGLAESLDSGGPILDTLSQLAQEHAIHLLGGGMPEQSPDPERPFNSAVLFEPSGALVAAYRKTHLFDVKLADGSSYAESASTQPGSEAVVVDVRGVRVGLAICYDLRFSALFEQLSQKGAEVCTLTAAFTEQTGKAHWRPLLRARAIEWQVWIVAAAQWGVHPGGRRTHGSSLVCDPWGSVVAERAENPGVVVAELDLDYLEQVRQRLPCAAHRQASPFAKA